MVNMLLPLGEPLAALLNHPFASVEHVSQAGSTNQVLLNAPFEPRAAPPRLLWADTQSAGRGRRGRVWHSEDGASLLFSVALESLSSASAAGMAHPSAFSLVAGVALAESLEACGSRYGGIALKWPNDLVRHDTKLAGILIETRTHADVFRLVVGCGVNLRAPVIDAVRATPGATETPAYPDALPAGGLLAAADALPGLNERERLVANAAIALARSYHAFMQSGFAPFRERWLSRDWLAGRAVSITDSGRELACGAAVGIADSGALLVDDGWGALPFSVGDVSARPVTQRTPVSVSAGDRGGIGS